MERSLSWKKFIILCISAIKVCKKLIFDFGYGTAILRGEAVDRNGNPIPWFTYPCVDYLKQLDLRDKSAFEWGPGNSTLFLASRCKDVTSVEECEVYYKKN